MKKTRSDQRQFERKNIYLILLTFILVFSVVLMLSIFQKDSFGQNVISNRNKSDENRIKHKPDLVKVNVNLSKREKNAPLTQGDKFVSLTLDDGPGYNSTQRVLDVLAKYNAKATWFVLGSRADQNADMLKVISNAGHEIGNHSYLHKNLVNISMEEAMNEINSTQNSVKNIIGKSPSYLRPPYGSYNDAIASSSGLGIAMWNVDSLDWQSKSGQAAYNHVLNTLRRNPVILFHDIYESSADAIEMLVPKLTAEGYIFVTFSQYKQLGL